MDGVVAQQSTIVVFNIGVATSAIWLVVDDLALSWTHKVPHHLY